ncbi:carbamoyltransferase HypF, partial [Caminibacter sp.]
MRVRLFFEGIVQGVGFRPSVYKVAKSLGLTGFVLNEGRGVLVEVEGEKAAEFKDVFLKNLPPLAKVDNIKEEILEKIGYDDFEIKESKSTSKTTSISPDISVCEDCLREMYDKNNRRYLYPFINCTNCGPRYTIIENIPYDRKNTSMKKFKMCKKCEEEYKDPQNRRYHAEPISCYECGPKLSVKCKVESEKRDYISEKLKVKSENLSELIASKIKEGKIVAIKGLGGFHLVCDATNEEAVRELRLRKRRPSKPFAMMFKDLKMIEKYCEINDVEKEAILSKERPIVIVKKKIELKGIADKIDRYGVFLPYTPLHYLLFDYLDFPIVATSANISDEPIIRDGNELIEKLGNVVDFVLDNDRDIVNACDDSVVQVIDDEVSFMRLSRGYAPKSFFIDKKIKPKILAVGANQKNTISLAFENKIILSPHIGDLGTVGSIEYFERTIETFRRLYDFREDYIICDIHPYYESTKWAKNQQKKVFEIQHHYAHVLPVMWENGFEEVLAFVFDGTGYGIDGAIWGGEVFIANRKNFQRIAHLKYFKLIGGEKAVKNPANMAVALIDEELAKNYPNFKIAKALKNASFPLTSSMGRLFDMVAFLSGMIDRNEYEGLSGLMIEKFFNPELRVESVELRVANGEIDIVPMLNFAAKHRGNFELVSNVFINSIVEMILEISKNVDLPVVVSGGVFQNKTLLSEILKRKKVFFSKNVPVNDGGISFGQVLWGV